MDILIRNATVITGDGCTVHENAWIGIEKDRIVEVGQGASDRGGEEEAACVIDASEMMVLSGVINAHTHGCSVGPLFSSAAKPLPVEHALRNMDRHLRQGVTTVVNVCGMGCMDEVEDVARRHVLRLRTGTNHFPSSFEAARMVDGEGLTPRHVEITPETMLEDGAVLLGEIGSGATLGGGVSIYKYIPEAVARETGTSITPQQAQQLKEAILGAGPGSEAPDTEAIAQVLQACGLDGALSAERAREIVEPIVREPMQAALAGFEEAAALSAKTGVPAVFHTCRESYTTLLDLARRFENTPARLVAGHVNHPSFSVEESVRAARELRSLGVVIDVSTLDGLITRWLTGPEHMEALFAEDLVDTISTDYAAGHWDGILEAIHYLWRRGHVDLPKAVAMATGNVARVFSRAAPDRGLIETGKVADIVLVDKRNVGRVEKVLIGGSVVLDGGWLRF